MLKNLRILIDGKDLELRRNTGIKNYGLSLIKALLGMQAEPYILFSKHSRYKDPLLNTDIFSLFDDTNLSSSTFQKIKIMTKAIFSIRQKLISKPVLKDLIITRGINGFEFINQASIFSLPECFRIASFLCSYGISLKIKSKPRMDLWHTTNLIPIRMPGVPRITTFHDLVPLRLPYTTFSDKSLYLKTARHAIRYSDLLITVSEATRKDLIRFFNVKPEKISVTYQPLSFTPANHSRDDVNRILEGYELEYQNYILFVGAIEPKKNLGRLIAAYNILKTYIPLVIVGPKAWMFEQDLSLLEQKKHLQKTVKLLGYVPESNLTALYMGATCLAFPSIYEGFGLPPLEAMSLGCPVLTSDISSLPEICGDAALYVDPYQATDIAEKLKAIINDEPLRNRLRQSGYARAAFFSMENYRKRLQDAYLKVL